MVALISFSSILRLSGPLLKGEPMVALVITSTVLELDSVPLKLQHLLLVAS